MKTRFLMLFVAVAAFAQTGAIRPGSVRPGGTIHRDVDLTDCAWIDFKHATSFDVRVGVNESTVSIDRPGHADCVSAP
jgi:hypothetical protein